MYLYPKNQLIKHPKYKYFFKQIKYNSKIITVCNFTLLTKSFSLITLNQLQVLKKYLQKRLKKKSFKYFKINLNCNLFKKSSKARMGKGIGKFAK